MLDERQVNMATPTMSCTAAHHTLVEVITSLFNRRPPVVSINDGDLGVVLALVIAFNRRRQTGTMQSAPRHAHQQGSPPHAARCSSQGTGSKACAAGYEVIWFLRQKPAKLIPRPRAKG